jgi:eukaryotic-like serine/threonine-protein kinase
VIAAILEREPSPLEVAPPLERVIRTCLAKDPDDRFQNARDLKRNLIWALEQPVAAKGTRRGWIAVAALALGAAGGWVVAHFGQPAASEHVFRLQINPPPGAQVVLGAFAGGLAISPDGKTAAYIALVNGKSGLWIRPFEGVAARLLPGTENAGFPFWSPDSKSIAFVVGPTTLYRVDVRGGAPVVISDVGLIFTGGSWGSDGYILLSTLNSGIFRVPASGGKPSRVLNVDTSRGEVYFRWPQVLPGGRFLYWVEGSKPEYNGVYAVSLAKPRERVKLLSNETNAVYAPGVEGKGYLLWTRGGTLVAQEFDPQSLQFAGEPQAIAEGLNPSSRRQMPVAVSANGALLYGAFGAVTQLAWFDRTGKMLRQLGEPVEEIVGFRLSPDERRIAVHRSTAGVWDLWLIDVERGLSSRFTTGTGYHHPIWSPDGRMILYSQIGSRSMLRKAANGTGDEQVAARLFFVPDDWSGDGHWVLARALESDTKSDIWTLPMTPDGRMQESAPPKPYLRTAFNESESRFSPEPNPRWVAYQSDESGRFEVYIDAFPEPRGKKRISTGGGRFPQWGGGGREIFYLSPDDKLMAVSLKLGADTVEPSAPRELFTLPLRTSPIGPTYEASRDGRRFLVLTSPETAPRALNVIVNWPALLKKGAAAP